jgi:hypothetical protein
MQARSLSIQQDGRDDLDHNIVPAKRVVRANALSGT